MPLELRFWQYMKLKTSHCETSSNTLCKLFVAQIPPLAQNKNAPFKAQTYQKNEIRYVASFIRTLPLVWEFHPINLIEARGLYRQ